MKSLIDQLHPELRAQWRPATKGLHFALSVWLDRDATKSLVTSRLQRLNLPSDPSPFLPAYKGILVKGTWHVSGMGTYDGITAEAYGARSGQPWQVLQPAIFGGAFEVPFGFADYARTVEASPPDEDALQFVFCSSSFGLGIPSPYEPGRHESQASFDAWLLLLATQLHPRVDFFPAAKGAVWQRRGDEASLTNEFIRLSFSGGWF